MVDLYRGGGCGGGSRNSNREIAQHCNFLSFIERSNMPFPHLIFRVLKTCLPLPLIQFDLQTSRSNFSSWSGVHRSRESR